MGIRHFDWMLEKRAGSTEIIFFGAEKGDSSVHLSLSRTPPPHTHTPLVANDLSFGVLVTRTLKSVLCL